MPTPTGTENKEDFLQRCMGDSEMLSEFEDNTQRYAVCVSKWIEGNSDDDKKLNLWQQEDQKA